MIPVLGSTAIIIQINHNYKLLDLSAKNFATKILADRSNMQLCLTAGPKKFQPPFGSHRRFYF